jgi:enoyl-CoA hydratase
MAKRAVNRTMDIMGFENAIEQVFDIHELGHGNAQSFTGQPIIADLDGMKKKVKGAQ